MQAIRNLTVTQATILSAVVLIILLVGVVLVLSGRGNEPQAGIDATFTPVFVFETPVDSDTVTLVPVGPIDFGTDG